MAPLFTTVYGCAFCRSVTKTGYTTGQHLDSFLPEFRGTRPIPPPYNFLFHPVNIIRSIRSQHHRAVEHHAPPPDAEERDECAAWDVIVPLMSAEAKRRHRTLDRTELTSEWWNEFADAGLEPVGKTDPRIGTGWKEYLIEQQRLIGEEEARIQQLREAERNADLLRAEREREQLEAEEWQIAWDRERDLEYQLQLERDQEAAEEHWAAMEREVAEENDRQALEQEEERERLEQEEKQLEAELVAALDEEDTEDDDQAAESDVVDGEDDGDEDKDSAEEDGEQGEEEDAEQGADQEQPIPDEAAAQEEPAEQVENPPALPTGSPILHHDHQETPVDPPAYISKGKAIAADPPSPSDPPDASLFAYDDDDLYNNNGQSSQALAATISGRKHTVIGPITYLSGASVGAMLSTGNGNRQKAQANTPERARKRPADGPLPEPRMAATPRAGAELVDVTVVLVDTGMRLPVSARDTLAGAIQLFRAEITYSMRSSLRGLCGAATPPAWAGISHEVWVSEWSDATWERVKSRAAVQVSREVVAVEAIWRFE